MEHMIGIILAGGRATRIGGGDKGARMVGGLAILDRVVATLRPQCERLVLNANGAPERFASYGLPVVADDVADHPGPLAGVLAGLDWVAQHAPGERFAVTVPTDTPFLPDDLVVRLVAARSETGAQVVCARSGGETHYVAALWSVALRHDLRRALTDGLRKVARFMQRYDMGHADWAVAPHDPFLNVNSEEDLHRAEAIAAYLDR